MLLRNCPFCNADPIRLEYDQRGNETGDSDLWFVRCMECGADGPPAECDQRATDLWNGITDGTHR